MGAQLVRRWLVLVLCLSFLLASPPVMATARTKVRARVAQAGRYVWQKRLLFMGCAAALVGTWFLMKSPDYALSSMDPAPYTYRNGHPIPQFGPGVRVQEYFQLWDEEFEVHDGKQRWGTIERKWWNWTTAFEHRTPGGELVSRARVEFLKLHTSIEVTDPDGRRIGSIESNWRENILRKMFQTGTTVYTIYDADHKPIARSGRVTFGITHFELTDVKTGAPIASFTRSPFNYWVRLGLFETDVWRGNIQPNSRIDPRILPYIGVFKSSADNVPDDDD